MWNPGLAHTFHLQRSDIVKENISLTEYMAMVDALREQSGS